MKKMKKYEVFHGWALVGHTYAVSAKKAICNVKYRLGLHHDIYDDTWTAKEVSL